MSFDDWKRELTMELAGMYGETTDAMANVIDEAEDAYREMYDDGLTPSQARSEEYDAACWAAA